MIYYVTKQQKLFTEITVDYKYVSIEESLRVLEPLEIVGLDTETSGLDVWLGELLTLQLGNKYNQVVIDCTTIDVKHYKPYLESNRLFLGHNLKFDTKWLLKEGIILKRVYDTFLAERILYLGFPPGMISLSLQACCMRYLDIYLDKSVRGSINKGMTLEVLVYAAKDVVYLEDIREAQLFHIRARKQEVALDIENEFVKPLSYIEYMGIGLDIPRWKAKMTKDQIRLNEAKVKLDSWVVKYILDKDDTSRIAYNYVPKLGKKGKKTVLSKDIFIVSPMKSLFDLDNTIKYECIINWNSSSQVIVLLEELGLDLWTKDKKTGKLKKSVDSKFISLQKSKSDIIPIYLEYSAAFKVVSSFGQNFLDAVNPKTGRIHPNFNQMQDTGRLSCGSGGKGKSNSIDTESSDEIVNTKDKSVNLQQLPADPETRACFIPYKGYKLIDADYGDQEGHIFTDLSNDKSWIEFYNSKDKRDGHSFVAKMIFQDELKDIPESEVKTKRKDLRDAAKPARFTFNYNGTAAALAANTGKPLEFCEQCFKTYFEVFNGIKSYFVKQKKEAWDRGYILISEITGLRAYIYDYPTLKGIEKRINSTSFWDNRREAIASGKIISDVPKQVIQEVVKRFSENIPISGIATTYEYEEKKGNKVNRYTFTINSETIYAIVTKYFYKRKSSIENQSCNFSSQGTAAAMTKVAAIKYYNHLIKDNLLFKVFIPNDVHDELLIEAPEEIAEQEAIILKQCMEDAADIFCKQVKIKAVPEIGDCWLH